jgi:hypothetical protein
MKMKIEKKSGSDPSIIIDFLPISGNHGGGGVFFSTKPMGLSNR